jgi:hypothetical protein
LIGYPDRAGARIAGPADLNASHAEWIRLLIKRLNHGLDFGRETAVEWMKYLRLFAAGRAEALMNPYAGLRGFDASPISRDAKHLNECPWIRQLSPLSRPSAEGPRLRPGGPLGRTLMILAVGGADTTFYGDMTASDIETFVRGFVPADFLDCLDPLSLWRGVPRAFAAKLLENGREVTVVESLMEQAHAAGITHVAVMTNSATAPAVTKYLERRFPFSSGLKWTVTVQPLMPVIAENPETGDWAVSEENGGIPAGHGHGFKHALQNDAVRGWTEGDGLEYFLFSNGDNAALFNGGAGHFSETLETMRSLKQGGGAPGLRSAFYLVWEEFRKGGFAFCLTERDTGIVIPQIIEAELAVYSGVSAEALKGARCGYNTNVAAGFLAEAARHLKNLPLTLKRKKLRGRDHWMLEASFATAMSTTQDETGESHFDPGSSIVVLAPDEAVHPHWIHVSLRNRAEWLAYRSSIFGSQTAVHGNGESLIVRSGTDAATPMPSLEGRILEVSTGEFWEVFGKASLDMAGFTGVLRIDFEVHKAKPRGRIRFEGNIRFSGNGKVSFMIPAGESWIFRDKAFHSPAEINSAGQISA